MDRALAWLLVLLVMLTLCSVLLHDQVVTFLLRSDRSSSDRSSAGVLRRMVVNREKASEIIDDSATLGELEHALRLRTGELRGLLEMRDTDDDIDEIAQESLDKPEKEAVNGADTDDPEEDQNRDVTYPNCAALRRKNSPLVTVFTTMHPAKDPLKILAQQNTLQAYKNLAPLVQGLIFTRDRYWQEEAKRLGIQVIDNHALNPFGTPILRDMYRKAFASSTSYFATFANADILFGNDFVDTLCAVEDAIRKGAVKNRVMVTGQRLNYELKPSDRITADFADHEHKLKLWSRGANAELFQVNAEDFFVFNRQALDFSHIPKFVVGRPGYDNCLVNLAVTDKHVTTIDATATTIALHQTGSDGNKAGHKYRADSEWNRRHCAKGYRKGSVKHCGHYTIMQGGAAKLRKRKNVDNSADLGVSYDDG